MRVNTVFLAHSVCQDDGIQLQVFGNKGINTVFLVHSIRQDPIQLQVFGNNTVFLVHFIRQDPIQLQVFGNKSKYSFPNALYSPRSNSTSGVRK